jgi:hypothetical protein
VYSVVLASEIQFFVNYHKKVEVGLERVQSKSMTAKYSSNKLTINIRNVH